MRSSIDKKENIEQKNIKKQRLKCCFHFNSPLYSEIIAKDR